MALNHRDSLGEEITFESNDRALVMRALLPGINPECLRVVVHGDTLTIAGDAQSPEPPANRPPDKAAPRAQGFCRSLRLPTPIRIDRAQARFQNGVLILTLPHPGSVVRQHSQIAKADISPRPPDAA